VFAVIFKLYFGLLSTVPLSYDDVDPMSTDG
jgi:hypothetical protein